LFNNTTGADSVAVGIQALVSNSTGNYNTAIGHTALQANTTASNNTAVGYQSGYSNTTGTGNNAFGTQAMRQNTTANYNSAFGHVTMYSNSTGTNNAAFGGITMYSNTTGSSNSAFGYNALYNNTTASNNTAVGYQAGYSTTTGGSNTYIGNYCGYAMTTGINNTILGRFNGNDFGLDIRTSNNNIVLSDGAGNPRMYYTNATVNWRAVTPSNSNNVLVLNNSGTSNLYGMQIDLNVDMNNGSNWFFNARGNGNARFRVYTNGNVVNTNNSYGSISDIKLKENIVDSGSQWDDIKALTVRKYSMKADNLDAPNMIGVIAQEVEAAGMGGLVLETPDATPDNPDVEGTTKQVNYSILYMKAVKALQEAMDRIETLEAKVTALENA